MSRYPDLVFDLDDTLIDSFSPYVAAHQRIAEELRMRVPSREELVVYLDTWERTLARLWPDADLGPFMARYAELTHEYHYPPIDGVLDSLAVLRERGHRLWIVTKRSRRLLGLRMQQAGLSADHFQGIFAFEDQPVTKPDPRCFEPVWRAGARPEQSLYVGDRVDDLLAASAAGMVFVAVSTGPEGAAAWEGPPARVAARHRPQSAAELPAWLTQHG